MTNDKNPHKKTVKSKTGIEKIILPIKTNFILAKTPEKITRNFRQKIKNALIPDFRIFLIKKKSKIIVAKTTTNIEYIEEFLEAKSQSGKTNANPIAKQAHKSNKT